MSAALLERRAPARSLPGPERERGGRTRDVALTYIFAIFPLTPAFVGFAALRPPGLSLVGPLVAAVIAAGAIAAAVALAWPRHPAGDVRGAALLRAMRLPVGLFVGAELLAALCGIDPATSLLVVGALTIAAVVHLALLRDGGSTRLRSRLVATFLVSATLSAALGFGAWACGRPEALMRVVNGRAVGTFVVPGEFAGYLVLAIAVAAGVAASRTGAIRRWAWATLVCAIPALAATYSRAGWFGCSVAMAVVIVAERPRRWVVIAVGTFLAVEARLLLGYSDHHNPSEEFSRLPIWQAAARAAELFPLTGTGPGAFRHLYPGLRPPSELAVAFHPHSAILGTFVESGAVGLAAVAFLVRRFGRTLAARLRLVPVPPGRPLALAIAAGLVGTAVQASVDEIQVLVLGCWLPFMALALAETTPAE